MSCGENFVEGSCVLIYDYDKYVRYRTIQSLAASMSLIATSIDFREVAFGNASSTGITSSNNFTYEVQNDLVIMGSSASEISDKCINPSISPSRPTNIPKSVIDLI